jgi:hypothetical protein
MRRPAGDPGTVAAGSRRLGAAAGALQEVRGRLVGAASSVVVARAWRGPASEAFAVDGAGLQAGLDRAADASTRPPGPCPSWPPACSTPRRPGTGPTAWPPPPGSTWPRSAATRQRPAATRRRPCGAPGTRTAASTHRPTRSTRRPCCSPARPWPWPGRPRRRRRPPAGPGGHVHRRAAGRGRERGGRGSARPAAGRCWAPGRRPSPGGRPRPRWWSRPGRSPRPGW